MDDGQRLLALAAAYLKCQGFSTQTEIAKEMGTTQSTVSGWLRDAKKSEWIREKPELDRSKIPRELFDRVDAQYNLTPRLNQKLRKWSDVCTAVVCAGSTRRDTYREVAAQLKSILTGSRLAAVVWGRTLANVIEVFPMTDKPISNSFQCIPVSGEPVHLVHREKDPRFHSTYLAFELERRVTGTDPKEMPLLEAVPAYIPTKFRSGDVKRFIEQIPGYREIFGVGTRKGMIRSTDTLITGVGMADGDNLGIFVQERLLQEPKPLQRTMRKWCLGDIAGVLIAENEADQRKLSKFNDGLVGMNWAILENCVSRAAQNGKPGVVVIAIEPEGKGRIIRAAVKRGIVSQLLVSRSIAKMLLEMT